MWGFYANLAMVKDGCSVIFVMDKKPMSNLQTTASTVDVHLVELLDIFCVPSAKFSNVLLSPILMMVKICSPKCTLGVHIEELSFRPVGGSTFCFPHLIPELLHQFEVYAFDSRISASS